MFKFRIGNEFECFRDTRKPKREVKWTCKCQRANRNDVLYLPSLETSCRMADLTSKGEKKKHKKECGKQEKERKNKEDQSSTNTQGSMIS